MGDTATQGQVQTDATATTETEAPITETDAPISDPIKKQEAQVNQVEPDLTDKEDWFKVRMDHSNFSSENIMEFYGKDAFGKFKSKDEYWEDDAIKKKFTDQYGFAAKDEFGKMYDLSAKEFSLYNMGRYQKSQSGFELIRDDISAARSDAQVRFSNIYGSVKEGSAWSESTKDYRENFNTIRVAKKNANGETYFEYEEFTEELKAEMEEDNAFGGLAYNDSFQNMDPEEGVNGMYYDAIYDGQVWNDNADDFVDVKNEQIVSNWDLESSGILGDFLKNNKLEADGVLDYAKILVKAPINMWFNLMDTGVQLTRAAVAGGYGAVNMFLKDDLDVRDSQIYKTLTTAGIKSKSGVASMSREAMEDGFFGSLEAGLSTTADVAVQIALAGALGSAGKLGATMMTRGMGQKAIMKAEARAAEVMVRGTLTAVATKDAYNEALDNGFTPSEAAIITGATAVALWQATKFASYILGDYEIKALRQNIKTVISNEQKSFLKEAFKDAEKTAVKAGQKALKGGSIAGEKKAALAIGSIQRKVQEIFGSAVKKLPSKAWIYEARQEGIEEMTEELYQDGVKHAASAYGYLMKDAHDVGKGRYMTIFDDGYLLDAVERFATSGVAGAIGGPMGMIGRHNVNLNPITDSSSIVDIIVGGKVAELGDVLAEMNANGE
ncbi:MAG: hypothetical protein KAH32_08445, partial [Chlamydiia bacterium]|nr:hypothetical protein [Chlamydiia bacterium]